MRVLYVGAGADLHVVTHLPREARLVCVDGQPLSRRCGCSRRPGAHARGRFLEDLDRSAGRLGLTWSSDDDDPVRLYGDRVRYYTNTSVPEHLDRIRHESPFSTLVVRGHRPHRDVVDLLSARDNVFVGFSDAAYDACEEEEDVVSLLHSCAATRARFRTFTLVADRATRIHCQDWFDLVRHAQKKGGWTV